MSRPVTPNPAVPATNLSRSNTQKSGYGGSRPVSYVPGEATGLEATDQYSGAPREASLLSQTPPKHDGAPVLQRSGSHMSQSATAIPSRGGTLKKKASLKRVGSMNRSGSKKSSYAGSVRSMRLGEKEKYEPSDEQDSAFYCPVPITGSPTDLLADRFQTWRKVLKDLIGYFRDLQKSYDIRAKTLHTASTTINSLSMPSNLVSQGGLGDAIHILRDFHKLALNESNKSKDLENEVILQLTGLRSDLHQKIKEIKSLSSDFKNSVSKEQDSTRKAVRALQESLGSVDQDAAATAGKGDPFLVKLSVDRQLERQIEEENYLHRAYLNLEASGRELESIVVGEIQKAYNVLAGIMKREADHSYETAEKLREGPIALPKDHEWDQFVTGNSQMVDPRMPLRQFHQITYAGKDHPAAMEVKSGMLERKSKYLKNYTPGWYVLSPTHLHEFKSADRINFQSPIMSLYLPEQKLGTHSEPGSNSHKFMLKGRQTGSMHRGHSWIFRAETYDTMVAWYNDIKELTEKRGEARNEFVRRTRARTLSSGSMKAASISGSTGSGMEDDEADQVAFAGEQSIRGQSLGGDGSAGIVPAGYAMDDQRSEPGWRPQRPTPGGRFPSDINVQRGLQAPLSPSSGDSFDETDRDAIAAAGALPGSGLPFTSEMSHQPHTDQQQPIQQSTHKQSGNELAGAAESASSTNAGIQSYTAGDHQRVAPTSEGAVPADTASTYGEWMAPIAAGVGGAGLGVAGANAYDQQKQDKVENLQGTQGQRKAENVRDQQNAIPAPGYSSPPIMTSTAAPIDAPTRPRGMSGSTADTLTATTRSTHPSAHSESTMLSSIGTGIGDESEMPSTVQQNLEQNQSSNPVAPIDTTGYTTATGTDPAGHKRPEMPYSAKSVMTISDLHIPGEFPQNAP